LIDIVGGLCLAGQPSHWAALADLCEFHFGKGESLTLAAAVKKKAELAPSQLLMD